MMRFLLSFVMAMFVAGSLMAACSVDKVALRGAFGRAEISVELADTPDKRSQGLMFRQTMPRFAGMLFIYEHTQRATFWMKNTPLPLDMLFADETGTITRIAKQTEPQSLDQIDGGRGVLAVLEVNGGLADMLGVTVGDQMRHPAFGDKAAWGCD